MWKSTPLRYLGLHGVELSPSQKMFLKIEVMKVLKIHGIDWSKRPIVTGSGFC